MSGDAHGDSYRIIKFVGAAVVTGLVGLGFVFSLAVRGCDKPSDPSCKEVVVDGAPKLSCEHNGKTYIVSP